MRFAFNVLTDNFDLVIDDELVDLDGDTKIQIEESSDEDIIRFDIGDAEGTAYADLIKIGGDTTGFIWNDAGAALDMRFEGDAEPDLFFLDGSADSIALGTQENTVTLDGASLTGRFVTALDTDDDVEMMFKRHSDTFSRGILGIRSRGSEGAESRVLANDSLFTFTGAGWDGTDYATMVRIDFQVGGGPFSEATTPGRMIFSTGKVGSTGVFEAMRIDRSQNVLIGSTTGSDQDISLNADGSAVFNEQGNSVDFRIEGDTVENLVFVDGSLDSVGICTNVTSYSINGGTVYPTVSQLRKDAGDTINSAIVAYSDTATRGSFFTYLRARGSATSSTAVQDGDTIGVFRGDGHDGTEFITGAQIAMLADGTPSTGSVPQRINLRTGNNTGDITTRLTIRADGDVGIGTVTPTGRLGVQGGNVVFFEDNTGYLFRVEATGEQNFFRADGSNSQFKLGDSTAGTRLDVRSDRFIINNAGNDMDVRMETPNQANAFLLDSGNELLSVDVRFQTGKGADVASANTLTLGSDGNVFDITGTTTINNITTTNWQSGSEIILKFDGVLTLTNQATGSGQLRLAGSANLTTAVNTRIKLFLDGTNWWEISRTLA